MNPAITTILICIVVSEYKIFSVITNHCYMRTNKQNKTNRKKNLSEFPKLKLYTLTSSVFKYISSFLHAAKVPGVREFHI